MDEEKKDEGEMTVREAGHMGGQRESELVEEGKETEEMEPEQDEEDEGNQ